MLRAAGLRGRGERDERRRGAAGGTARAPGAAHACRAGGPTIREVRAREHKRRRWSHRRGRRWSDTVWAPKPRATWPSSSACGRRCTCAGRKVPLTNHREGHFAGPDNRGRAEHLDWPRRKRLVRCWESPGRASSKCRGVLRDSRVGGGGVGGGTGWLDVHHRHPCRGHGATAGAVVKRDALVCACALRSRPLSTAGDEGGGPSGHLPGTPSPGRQVRRLGRTWLAHAFDEGKSAPSEHATEERR